MRSTILLLSFFIYTSSWSQPVKLSIQTWTFHKFTFLESVDKANSLGIKYLEVYPGQKIGAGFEGSFTYTMSNDQRDRIKKILAAKRVQVVALGVIDKYYYTKDNLEKFFEFAKYMDIFIITAEPEWEDLDEFNRLAGKYHMSVGLHCHPKPASHYWHPDSTLKAMQGRQYIGAWPDLGHWARNGVDIRAGLKKLKAKLWGLHFKDVVKFNDVHAKDTLFGKGVCDLAGVMKQLRKLKFTGIVSMEYEANEDDNMNDMRDNKSFYEGRQKNK